MSTAGETHSQRIPGTILDEIYTLTVLSGPAKGTTVQLQGKHTFVVGRGEGADVIIDDPNLSRRHFAIDVLRREGGLLIRDLGSKNGTYVRNCRVLDALIDEQGLVEVGEDTIIRLSLPQAKVTGYGQQKLQGTIDPRLRAAAYERSEVAKAELEFEDDGRTRRMPRDRE